MPAATQASAFGAATRADRRFRAAMMAARPRAGRPVYPSQAFAGSGVQVQAVRDFVAGSFAGHPAAADAVLVASELAANAIMHSASGQDGGLFMVHLTQVGADFLAVMITDQGGPGEPHDVQAGPDAESGRGLAVVGSLTSCLTWFGDDHQRSVLAVVPAAPPAPDSGPACPDEEGKRSC